MSLVGAGPSETLMSFLVPSNTEQQKQTSRPRWALLDTKVWKKGFQNLDGFLSKRIGCRGVVQGTYHMLPRGTKLAHEQAPLTCFLEQHGEWKNNQRVAKVSTILRFLLCFSSPPMAGQSHPRSCAAAPLHPRAYLPCCGVLTSASVSRDPGRGRCHAGALSEAYNRDTDPADQGRFLGELVS